MGFGIDEQIANRDKSIASKRHTNLGIDGSLQATLQPTPFPKTQLWKWNFKFSSIFWKGGNPLEIYWFKCMASGRRGILYCLKLEKMFWEFPVIIIKMWTTCHTRSRLRIQRVLAVFQRHLCSPDAPIRALKGCGFAEISTNNCRNQWDRPSWRMEEALIQNWLL